MRRAAVFVGVIWVLAACASTDGGGWTGNGAQPFDAAYAECQTLTQATRGAAFEACMAQKGWTRPQR